MDVRGELTEKGKPLNDRFLNTNYVVNVVKC